MLKEIKDTYKQIKDLEKRSKNANEQAEYNAHDFVKVIRNSSLSKKFNGFRVDKLCTSPHNVQYVKSRQLVNRAAKKLNDLILNYTDPDSVMPNYEGEVMPVNNADEVFAYFDDTPEMVENDADNNRFLADTNESYVTMDGGDVHSVKINDINYEYKQFINYMKDNQIQKEHISRDD